MDRVDILAWTARHERAVFVDATPSCIGIVRPGYDPVSVPLSSVLPIYLAEYVAALVAIFLMSDADPFTVYTDNIGVYFNLHKGRCPRAWLPIMLHLFHTRQFSVRYIPSNCNPADAPSRATWW